MHPLITAFKAAFPMTRGARYAVVGLFCMAWLMTGVNLIYTAHVVDTSDHKWCQTLDLLTSHPVPKPTNPAGNPSRENAYQLYADFVKLRRDLGC